MVDHASRFFSVVQKADDIAADTLTVRARVRGDLDALREHYLPSLGQVQESKTNDYRFRALAPRADVAAAMASMVNQLKYSNFKSQVATVQGMPVLTCTTAYGMCCTACKRNPASTRLRRKRLRPPGQSFIRRWANRASVSSSKTPASPVL